MSTVFTPKNLDAEISREFGPPHDDDQKSCTGSLSTLDDNEDNWNKVSAGTTVSPNCWPEFSKIGSINGSNIASTVYSGNLIIAWIGATSGAIRVMKSSDGTTWPSPTNLFSGVTVKQVSITVATMNSTTKLWMAFLDGNNRIRVSSSTNGTTWTTPVITTWTATSLSIYGYQTSAYIAFTAVSNNAVTIVSTSNGFTNSSTTVTPYFGKGVSLTTFQNNFYLAYAGNTSPQRVYIAASTNGTTWSNTLGSSFYAMRTNNTVTPGQQWYASFGSLSLSSDSQRIYLAFAQYDDTIYVASTMDPTQGIWSNATPVPNTANTRSACITPWTPSGSSNTVYLLRVDDNTHDVEIAPYYLLSFYINDVLAYLQTTFPTSFYYAQVEDNYYIPLNGNVFQYLYINYSNTNTLLGNMKCIPNNFASDSFITVMKSIVSKYSYGDYPDMDAPTYINYFTGDVDVAYDYRWTSLSGLCGLIYAIDSSAPAGQQYRCFNFTVDINSAIVCFDPQTGTTIMPSNGKINGYTPTSIIF